MCGIVGFVDHALDGDAGVRVLQDMADAIRHRGPDDEGFYQNSPVGLGMRRLSIVDLAHGHQPMESQDGRYHLIFNGEIYNHVELRRELTELGAVFQTRSDTEVLLRVLERFGTEGIHRLNGMFAFALWDQAEKQLTLVRDRMGVKPLYYHWDGERLFFASEMKALIASGQVARDVNEKAIWDFLTLRYVPAPDTIWRNVHKLPPAHVLTISLGGALEVKRYWDIPYGETSNVGRSENDLLDEFSALFEDAVALRMVADVPVGIMLSGGLDSSTLAAAAQASGFERVETFSVGFEHPGAVSELPYARDVAGKLGCHHHEIVLGEADFLDGLQHLARSTDEPLADAASIPLFKLSQLARESVTVALSGEGSDEVLGGYDFDKRVARWYAPSLRQSLRHVLRSEPLFGLLRRAMPERAKEMQGRGLPVDLRDWMLPPNMTNFLSSDDKMSLMKLDAPMADSLAPLCESLSRLGLQPPLHQLLYLYCQDWLVEDLLMKADKMSMAASLELRTPFLDYRLVEWAARAPWSIKVGRDRRGNWTTKKILRRYARGRIPQSILERPKEGFPVPVISWLSGSWRRWVRERLLDKGSHLATLFDTREITVLVDRGTAKGATLRSANLVWNLLVLDHWFAEWKAA